MEHIYRVREDFNETVDLADRYPEKVRELAELFESEAWEYNIFPLKDQWVNANRFVFDGRKQLVLCLGGRSYAEALGFQFVNASNTAGKQITVQPKKTIPSGKVIFKADVVSTGDEILKNKTVTLSVNGEKVIAIEIGAQLPIMNPLSWIVIQAGRNFGTSVSAAYKSPFTFTGKMEKVTIDTL
jgi:arylsulfatase